MSLNVSPRNYPLLPLRAHQESLASPAAAITDRALEGEGSLAGVGSAVGVPPTLGLHPPPGRQEGSHRLVSMPPPSAAPVLAQGPGLRGTSGRGQTLCLSGAFAPACCCCVQTILRWSQPPPRPGFPLNHCIAGLQVPPAGGFAIHSCVSLA